MHGRGHSARTIARELGLARNTVIRYLNSPDAIVPKPRPPRGSKLDSYTEYIDRRLAEGLENCVVLLRELRARGYQGNYTVLIEYVRPRRRGRQPWRPSPPAWSRAAWSRLAWSRARSSTPGRSSPPAHRRRHHRMVRRRRHHRRDHRAHDRLPGARDPFHQHPGLTRPRPGPGPPPFGPHPLSNFPPPLVTPSLLATG